MKLKVITLKSEGWITDFAKARNEELKKIGDEWVLFVDSDEKVSPALAKEIEQAMQSENGIAGYRVERKDRFLGKWLKYGEVGRVRIVRLAKRSAGVWERPVHEAWKIKGKIGELKNPLWHYHDSVMGMIERMDRYSEIESKYRGKQNSTKLLLELCLFPPGKFIWNYFLKLGFLDGREGFILAGLMSFHSFLVRAKCFEKFVLK